MNAKVYNNDIKTTKFGIRLSLGSAGNHIYSNIFDDASDWGLYTYEGSDDPTSGVSDGRPAYNVFENNEVTGTAGGVKFKNSDNLSVIGEFGGCPPQGPRCGVRLDREKVARHAKSCVAQDVLSTDRGVGIIRDLCAR